MGTKTKSSSTSIGKIDFGKKKKGKYKKSQNKHETFKKYRGQGK